MLQEFSSAHSTQKDPRVFSLLPVLTDNLHTELAKHAENQYFSYVVDG